MPRVPAVGSQGVPRRVLFRAKLNPGRRPHLREQARGGRLTYAGARSVTRSERHTPPSTRRDLAHDVIVGRGGLADEESVILHSSIRSCDYKGTPLARRSGHASSRHSQYHPTGLTEVSY